MSILFVCRPPQLETTVGRSLGKVLKERGSSAKSERPFLPSATHKDEKGAKDPGEGSTMGTHVDSVFGTVLPFIQNPSC